MANWSWSIGPWASGASRKPTWSTRGGVGLAELTAATGRTLRLKLAEPSEAAFSLPGKSDQAALVEDLITDLWVSRDGVTMFRGRIMGPDHDTIDGTKHVCQFAAEDYRGVLDRRILYADRTWTAIDQATIAWDVLTDMQAQTGGNINIIKGTWPGSTGVNRTVTFKAGDQVFSGALKKLAAMDGGFDFDIDATFNANLWYPACGVDNGVVLDYGGLVASVERTFDPSTYANAIRQSGADTITPVTATVANIATAPEGRWDAQFGDTQLTTTDMVTQTGNANLVRASQPTASYTLKMARSRWGGFGHVGLGDWVTVVVKSGRLTDVVKARVYQIDVDLGVGGAEDVTIYVGTVIADARTILRGIGRRLAVLAKR